MLRRAWHALLSALASLLARWADGAHVRLRAVDEEDKRELRRQLEDEKARNERTEANLEYQLAWRASELALLKARTQARVARGVLATEKTQE